MRAEFESTPDRLVVLLAIRTVNGHSPTCVNRAIPNYARGCGIGWKKYGECTQCTGLRGLQALYRVIRASYLKTSMPRERSSKFSEARHGALDRRSTREELVARCNELAAKVGIGYRCTVETWGK